MMISKRKVLLRGPFTIASGYGTHARQIAKWFYDNQDKFEIKFELTPWGDCYSIVDTEYDNGLIGWIYQSMVDEQYIQSNTFDLSVQVQLPNEWNPNIAVKNIGVTAGVEATLCNPKWIESINSMSTVIVPSEFVKETFEATSKITNQEIRTSIIVVPEAYDEAFGEKIEPLNLGIESKFNFLLFGQLTGNNPFNDRKNIPQAVKWFIEEFKGENDVGLVIKTGTARAQHFDRRSIAAVFQQFLIEMGYDSDRDPRITIIHGNLSPQEVAGLYLNPTIKALYAPTRGEGFFIPGINAAAVGMPVLATGWSAHTEYLNLGKWIKFDYELKEVHPSRVDDNIFMRGTQWAETKEADVKYKLRKFYTDSKLPTAWAEQTKTKILENYSIESIKKHYTRIFV